MKKLLLLIFISLLSVSYTFGQSNKKAKENYDIATRYYTGKGVKKDYSKAIEYYKLAADMGYEQAILGLANCYFKGEGTPKNYNEAAKLYQKLAQKGNVEAIAILGDCYMKGYGVTRNLNEGFNYYKKAADKGHVIAQANLAECYEKGIGTIADRIEAMKWYNLAARKGNRSAQIKVDAFNREIEAEYKRAESLAESDSINDEAVESEPDEVETPIVDNYKSNKNTSLFSNKASSEQLKLRARSMAIAEVVDSNYTWGEWTDCNISVIFDSDTETIKIMSQVSQTYRLLSGGEEFKDDNDGKQLKFLVIDQDNDRGTLRLRQESNGNAQLYVDFNNIAVCYNIESM